MVSLEAGAGRIRNAGNVLHGVCRSDNRKLAKIEQMLRVDGIGRQHLHCGRCGARTGAPRTSPATRPTPSRPASKSMEFGWNNNGAGQARLRRRRRLPDYDYDYGRRAAELKFSLLFYSSTELDYFINQNPLAIEFNLKGSLIAAGRRPCITASR